MNLNNYFDKIYCINLDKRHERIEQFQTEVNKIGGFEFERYSAVDGELLVQHPLLKQGACGCLQSHLDILKTIVNNNLNNVLIFEDDTVFLDEFKNFNEYIKQLPQNWDMLYFGGNQMRVTIPITENIHKVTKCFTTSYYAITNKMARIMIPIIEKMESQIDVLYSKQHLNYNCYVFNPKLCIQRPGYSDVLNKEVNYKKELGF